MSDNQGDTRPYDAFDFITPENKEEFSKKIEKVKPEKLKIFKMVKEALEKNNIEYWLDGGTLLGAYRDGKMIPHDLDIDFAVLGDENLDKAASVLEIITPAGYTVRRGHHKGINAKKVELTRTGYEATDPESVWVDIMLYTYNKEEDYVWNVYFGYGLEKNRYKLNWIFPLGTIKFEGFEASCPNNAEAYLTEMYGYLGTDCCYNKETNKYYKR